MGTVASLRTEIAYLAIMVKARYIQLISTTVTKAYTARRADTKYIQDQNIVQTKLNINMGTFTRKRVEIVYLAIMAMARYMHHRVKNRYSTMAIYVNKYRNIHCNLSNILNLHVITGRHGQWSARTIFHEIYKIAENMCTGPILRVQDILYL
jgi:nitrate reductase beta subunit